MGDFAVKNLLDELFDASVQTDQVVVDLVRRPAGNVFCPTGEGGGVDPTCSPKGKTAQTDTPAFKRWFGDSKVVDEQGKPLVVYHGTTVVFDQFEVRDSLIGLATVGHWFTTKKINAQAIALRKPERLDSEVPVIVTAYLSIQNPMVYHEFQSMLNDVGGSFEITKDETSAYRRRLEAAGHDGIVIERNNADGVYDSQFIAFKPTQIKSATGNRGTFDPADPIITHEWRPVEEQP